ncbi:MAG: response regulator transcription factor [Bacteroidales bacterium]|nr:response regulator transcription factor [Bacteroidales bacterium]
MSELKIYLVDDHDLFREGLKFLLQGRKEISSVFEASNGIEFLNNMNENKADIVLLDIEMPGLNGIETCQKALQIQPELKIIALSMYGDENFYSEMIDAGAHGFLLKNSKFDTLMQAIKEVSEDKNYFSPEILKKIITNMHKTQNRRTEDELSEREKEILYNICIGLSNLEIADKLFISKRTVDKHRENILLKTNAGNTAGLVIYAIKNGIFSI